MLLVIMPVVVMLVIMLLGCVTGGMAMGGSGRFQLVLGPGQEPVRCSACCRSRGLGRLCLWLGPGLL